MRGQLFKSRQTRRILFPIHWLSLRKVEEGSARRFEGLLWPTTPSAPKLEPLNVFYGPKSNPVSLFGLTTNRGPSTDTDQAILLPRRSFMDPIRSEMILCLKASDFFHNKANRFPMRKCVEFRKLSLATRKPIPPVCKREPQRPDKGEHWTSAGGYWSHVDRHTPVLSWHRSIGAMRHKFAC